MELIGYQPGLIVPLIIIAGRIDHLFENGKPEQYRQDLNLHHR